MRRILKFTIDYSLPFTRLPLGRYDKIIHVSEQHHQLTMWAEVDQQDMPRGATAPSNQELSTVQIDHYRVFTIIPTGGHIGNNMIYVGTALVEQGKLVWHVYEVVE